jgi:hypothetical protein
MMSDEIDTTGRSVKSIGPAMSSERVELTPLSIHYTYVFTITRNNLPSLVLPPPLTKGNTSHSTTSKARRLSHIMTSAGIGFDGFIKIPDRPLNFVPAKAGETIHLGQITCRILEDGSRTGTLSTIPCSKRGQKPKSNQPQTTASEPSSSRCPPKRPARHLTGTKCTTRPSTSRRAPSASTSRTRRTRAKTRKSSTRTPATT